jgi:DNA repair protein RecN (Recombination protein N)
MLKRLYIENYALIDRLDISFESGFKAITGETGAGKSILMDALDLVLGKRADIQALLDPSRKCIVEASFDISNYPAGFFFDENGLDYDELTFLRREISQNGKSRAFINDTPVNLSMLKDLGGLLIDIHAQHATSSLLDNDYQLSVIDSFAGIDERMETYRLNFRELLSQKKRLDDLKSREKQERTSHDYRQFLLDELELSRLMPGEDQELENDLSVMTHAEEIKSSLALAISALESDDSGALEILAQAESALRKVAPYHSELVQISERLHSAGVELKDLAGELARFDEGADFNPGQMELLQQRLDLINRLLHKHQARDLGELLQIQEKLQEELRSYASLEDEILELEKHLQKLDEELMQFATGISADRKAVIPAFEKEVMARLNHMGMPGCRFVVSLEDGKQIGISGIDRVTYLFNANLGHALKPLADVASGGELSRVMLSVKSVVSEQRSLPSIVYDEIDNGLSGDVAGRVGDLLALSARRMQVIVITHLPQIAGKASHQFTVYKDHSTKTTYSKIRLLDDRERVTELAKMIGGNLTTGASLAAAEELLNRKPELLPGKS